MSERTSPERAGTERQSGAGKSTSRTVEGHGASKANSPDKGGQSGKGGQPGTARNQRTWVPGAAAFVCLLIGLSDILAIFRPTWHDKLGRIDAFVPGTLTNVTVSAYAITGLLLLLLSHGMRRRKRRAWQAVLALLAFDVVIHFAHPWHRDHIYSAVVAITLLVALVYFHDQFYAVSDPRTRWNALWVFIGLVIADIAIGLGYQGLGHLAANYTFSQRLEDVVLQLVGISGTVQWLNDHRGDSYQVLTSALGVFT
ncbi:MAG: hypothetical protein JWM19_5151, partial [Actinomycetia bacterium]|nr:hypothetical protein [Actinomycetes bacterium]